MAGILRSANGVDHLLANSQFVARRIKKAYQRDATVIYPPVDLANMTMCAHKEDFYVTASRMVPYKRIDLIVQAFSQTPERRLVVIGDGPEMKRIKAVAGENVTILGYQPSEVLIDHLRRARAFVFAAEEDFGISVVEAQACGTPVIAFGRGGALESVIGLPLDRPTGVFFGEQTPESLLAAVGRFERNGIYSTPAMPQECRAVFVGELQGGADGLYQCPIAVRVRGAVRHTSCGRTRCTGGDASVRCGRIVNLNAVADLAVESSEGRRHMAVNCRRVRLDQVL